MCRGGGSARCQSKTAGVSRRDQQPQVVTAGDTASPGRQSRARVGGVVEARIAGGARVQHVVGDREARAAT